MPSTVGGLLLFVGFLVPGFLYYMQRRRWVEEKSESPLIETARLVSVSMFTNLGALGLFALARLWWPQHTPDIGSLLRRWHPYLDARPGYLLSWALILLAISSALAFSLALLSRTKVNVKWLAPDIVHTSAWNRYLGDKKIVPEGMTPFVRLKLSDGTLISGFVDWLSTEIDEVPDRDLVLATPIRILSGTTSVKMRASRFIVSARDIQQMFVSYLDYDSDAGADRELTLDGLHIDSTGPGSEPDETAVLLSPGRTTYALKFKEGRGPNGVDTVNVAADSSQYRDGHFYLYVDPDDVVVYRADQDDLDRVVGKTRVVTKG
jgi:hypothetical protein